MLKRIIPVLVLVIAALLPISAGFASPAGAAGHKRVYVLKHRSERCAAGYRKETVRVRRRIRGHSRRVRAVGCVELAQVRAAIDPSFVQSPTDPLSVTFSFSASDVGTSGLPAGVLTLTIQQAGAAGASSTCTTNVGGTLQGGSCVVELPSYGQWGLTVTYSGGTNVAATSASETVSIANPDPPTTTQAPVGISSPPAGATGTTTTTSTSSTTTSSTTTSSTTTSTTRAPAATVSWWYWGLGTAERSGSEPAHYGAPPDPLALTSSNEGTGDGDWFMAGTVAGNLSGDNRPKGSFSYAVSGPGSVSMSDSLGNTGCVSLAIYDPCGMTFATDGSYTVTVSWNSEDPTYASVPDALTTTVQVTG